MTGPAPRDRLDPAERALADALARGQDAMQGPSPALDAAILGAARAAVAARARAGADAPARRRRHRSPAWLRGGALAATLVIAVGVAWQLRPTFDVAGPAPEAQVAAPPASGTSADRRQDTARASAESSGPAAAPGVATDARAAAGSAEPTRAAPLPRRVEPAPDAPPLVFDEPVPAPAPAQAPASADAEAPPPAPPAPPPPPPPAPAQAPELHRALPDATARKARSAAATAAAAAARARDGADAADDAAGHRHAIATPPAHADEASERAERAGDEDWFDQPLDDTPPASVESPEVREAWLARVRELVAAERYTEARESFAEFRRRHPDAPVPADLRMLLGTE